MRDVLIERLTEEIVRVIVRAVLSTWSNRAIIVAALCSIAFALGVAGCGGKSDASGGRKSTASARSGQVEATASTSATAPAATSLSSKQFIARADGICGSANAAIVRSEARVKGKLHKPDAHAAIIARNQAIEEKAVEELGKLKPPGDLAGAWKKMSRYRQALARQLGVLATATKLRVANLSQLVASKKNLHSQLHKVGSKAGFKDCATVG